VISGKSDIPISDRRGYRETYREIFDSSLSDEMRKYHELGTAMNVTPLNALKAIPTRNLAQSEFKEAGAISGESFAENFLGRRVACAHCPVSCIHLATLREPYESEPYFYSTKMISYDYELIYALGSMLGISSAEKLLKLIDVVETFGLDAMSTGVALAWATEAQGKELISAKETGGLTLAWGDAETYLKAINFLSSKVNEFYVGLGKGVEYASSVYGGKEFALAFGGNEMPGYHTGPAAHLGYLIGSRHSHLDGAGYSIDQKVTGKEKITPEEIVDRLLEEESWRQILSSLVVCFFARGVYKPELVTKAFRAVGREFTEEELGKIGARILGVKYGFKLREGFSLSDLKIPERLFQTPTPLGELSREMIAKGLKIAEDKLCSFSS